MSFGDRHLDAALDRWLTTPPEPLTECVVCDAELLEDNDTGYCSEHVADYEKYLAEEAEAEDAMYKDDGSGPPF